MLDGRDGRAGADGRDGREPKGWKDRAIDWMAGALGALCLILVSHMNSTLSALEQRVNHLEGSERVFAQQLNDIQKTLDEIKGDLRRTPGK